MFKYLISTLMVTNIFFLNNCAFTSEYEYMDNLALSFHTDKSSSWHNYTKVYAKYFAALKDEPIKFLEIGIHRGDSVKLWEQYFTQAELHFIDISKANIEYYSDRSTYHYLDQSNAKALQDFIKKTGGNFDVIIDDGGHTMTQQLVSFQNLFPAVKSGGMYIIEDLHTSYWTAFGGGGSFDKPSTNVYSMTVFLQKRIDDVNYAGARTQCADFDKLPAYIKNNLTEYQKSIYSMHFYDSVCVIIKR